MGSRSRVSTEQLLAPHFVEWGASSEGEAGDFESAEFPSRREAIEFAQEKDRVGFSVWVGEIGAYETDRGNAIQDWIYYWWIDNSDWPLEDRERGKGYPYCAQGRLVTYTPYDKTDWKDR